jgi:hypothetical protein
MDVTAEIVRMKRSGYGPDVCYIYVKDYVSLEVFAHLYEAL